MLGHRSVVLRALRGDDDVRPEPGREHLVGPGSEGLDPSKGVQATRAVAELGGGVPPDHEHLRVLRARSDRFLGCVPDELDAVGHLWGQQDARREQNLKAHRVIDSNSSRTCW